LALQYPSQQSRQPERRVVAVARWPVGGIRTYLRALFEAPALEGYAFTLVAPDEEDLKSYLNLTTRRLEWTPCGSSSSAIARAVLAEIRRKKPQFVHSHGFISGSVTAAACELTRARHLLTVHDVLLDGQFAGLTGQARKLGLGFGLASSNHVHCVTADSRDNLLSTYPWFRSLRRKSTVIPHGVDTDLIVRAPRREVPQELGCAPGTMIFGFLGRFMAQKGFRYLVEAVGMLKSRGVSPERMRVLAVGSGGFLREDRERVTSMGLDGFFTFWPYHPEIASILKGIDCLVMPSLWEASGLLAMEAMVAGTPVIGTDCIGLRETLSDTPSVIVPPANAQALADALAKFLEHPTRNTAAVFQPEALERFSARRCFSTLASLYDRLCQRP